MILLLSLLLGVNGIKILQLADFHLDVDYSITGDNKQMCHNASASTGGKLGKYGDYMCDAPEVSMFSTFQGLNLRKIISATSCLCLERSQASRP